MKTIIVTLITIFTVTSFAGETEEYIAREALETQATIDALLELRADEAGLTVEEYIAREAPKRRAKVDAQFKRWADEAGLTVEEYIARESSKAQAKAQAAIDARIREKAAEQKQ